MAGQSAAERINALAGQIDGGIASATRGIADINLNARLLAMNTRIEAARLGAQGATFQVIGAEMLSLSERTGTTADALGTQTKALVDELVAISGQLASDVRGTRLADLALTNIDLIDRNLYERSCDCRWWATDAAFVQALEDPQSEARARAGARMAVILKAYTVYFDIVLADVQGNVVANGRGQQFRSQGTNHRDAAWFASAMATRDGDSFGFQSVHDSPLAGGERALVYSAKVCRGGLASGAPLGVLGIVFRWAALAEHIVKNTPVDAADKARTRAFIADTGGRLLADSAGRALVESFQPSELASLRAQGKGFASVRIGGKPMLVGFARSPGFETYATGWESYVVQQLAA